MPIKPENRARYPKNWKEIRERILERAGDQCEKCAVPNYALVRTLADGTREFAKGSIYYDAFQYTESFSMAAAARDVLNVGLEGPLFVVVVLTIAHLDHTPENCGDDNLRAWCQKCHLSYDAEHHKTNAAATRRARLAVADLPGLEVAA